jgi:hypothetical protein
VERIVIRHLGRQDGGLRLRLQSALRATAVGLLGLLFHKQLVGWVER